MSHGIGKWSGVTRVEFIPHSDQRYDTAGDWYLDGEAWHGEYFDLVIRISNTGNNDMNFALYMHELNEALVYLYKRNFDQSAVEAVDKFDKQFYKDEADSTAEPGCDPLAPYYAEHMYAMECEHSVAAQLRLDWNAYTEAIAELDNEKNA